MMDSGMMSVTAHHISAEDVDAAVGENRPLVLIALDGCPLDAKIRLLPPFPVIGIGDPAHPLAARLDTVIEPPMTVAGVVAGIERNPAAAAALVDLLRAIDGLDGHEALTRESRRMAMLQGGVEHLAWLAARRPAPAARPPGTVRIERHDAILDIVTDRPWALNAIDRAMRDGLREAFTVAALDADIASVRWRARGRAFGIGADLAEFGTTRDPATAHDIRMRTLPALSLLRCADRVIVHVQGACVGAALEMAAFAGHIVAGRDAWFQLPELAMGIIPGAGGCVSLPRRIGRRRAALMMLSGRRIGAETALRWGLIDAIEETAAGDERGADQL